MSTSRWATPGRTRRSSRSTWPTSGAAGPTTACCGSGSARGAASISSSCRSGCARCCPRRWARGSARSCCTWALTPEQADRRVADLIFAFEPGDLISETMSLGAPAPIEVVVSGRNLADSSTYMDKLREQFDGIGSLRDVQIQQSLHYPTVQVTLDRERAGLSGVTARDVGESLIAATYSSRYTTPDLLARRRQRQFVPGPGPGAAAEDDLGDRRRARAAEAAVRPPAGRAGRRLAVQPHAAAPGPRRRPRDARRDARRGRPLQHEALPQPDGQRRGRGPRPRHRPARRRDRPCRPAAPRDRGRAPRAGPPDAATCSSRWRSAWASPCS